MWGDRTHFPDVPQATAQSTRGNIHPTKVVCVHRGTDRRLPRATHDKRGESLKADDEDDNAVNMTLPLEETDEGR
jgi:hypothetical protein